MNKKILFILALALTAILPLLLAWLATPELSLPDILNTTPSTDRFIFFHLRLPKHVLAFAVGAALALAGMSFQSLLKNPLADPYILGVSGGAALGYVLAVVLKLPFYCMPFAGFLFALLSLVLIYSLAKTDGTIVTTNLLLTGVIFNSFSFAIILIINAIANFGQSQQILYLLLGSIDTISWPQIAVLSTFLVLAGAVLFRHANALNLLSLGDEEAQHLGVDIVREKKIIFVITSILVGASVSVCGLIGFVGLFVPHLLRLIFGADHRVLLPACALAGGLFLLLSNFIADHALATTALQTRLPVGVITALIGAPVFVYVLKKAARQRE